MIKFHDVAKFICKLKDQNEIDRLLTLLNKRKQNIKDTKVSLIDNYINKIHHKSKFLRSWDRSIYKIGKHLANPKIKFSTKLCIWLFTFIVVGIFFSTAAGNTNIVLAFSVIGFIFEIIIESIYMTYYSINTISYNEKIFRNFNTLTLYGSIVLEHLSLFGLIVASVLFIDPCSSSFESYILSLFIVFSIMFSLPAYLSQEKKNYQNKIKQNG